MLLLQINIVEMISFIKYNFDVCISIPLYSYVHCVYSLWKMITILFKCSKQCWYLNETFFRQTRGSNVNSLFGLPSTKKSAVDGDVLNFQVSINMLQYSVYFFLCNLLIKSLFIIIHYLRSVQQKRSNWAIESVTFSSNIVIYPATSCLPLGGPSSSGLHHHTPSHAGYLKNGRYDLGNK